MVVVVIVVVVSTATVLSFLSVLFLLFLLEVCLLLFLNQVFVQETNIRKLHESVSTDNQEAPLRLREQFACTRGVRATTSGACKSGK